MSTSKVKVAEVLHKVFVYGTLKRGETNHYWLTKPEHGKSCFLCEARTVQKYPLVVGTRYNIPFLLDKPGVGHHVDGEVYEVDNLMLSNLDILEDYPNYYDREVQSMEVVGKEKLDCWIYLIRKFPEHLLTKKYLQSYHNTKEQPYQERSQRDSNVKAIDDMTFYISSNKEDMYEPNTKAE